MIAAPWHAAGRRRHRDERDRDGAEIVFVAGIQQEGKANQPRARVAWTPRVTGSCSASLTCCPYPSLIPDPCPNRAGIGTKCPNPFSDPRDFQGLARGKTRSLSKIWEDSDSESEGEAHGPQAECRGGELSVVSHVRLPFVWFAVRAYRTL